MLNKERCWGNYSVVFRWNLLLRNCKIIGWVLYIYILINCYNVILFRKSPELPLCNGSIEYNNSRRRCNNGTLVRHAWPMEDEGETCMRNWTWQMYAKIFCDTIRNVLNGNVDTSGYLTSNESMVIGNRTVNKWFIDNLSSFTI